MGEPAQTLEAPSAPGIAIDPLRIYPTTDTRGLSILWGVAPPPGAYLGVAEPWAGAPVDVAILIALDDAGPGWPVRLELCSMSGTPRTFEALDAVVFTHRLLTVTSTTD